MRLRASAFAFLVATGLLSAPIALRPAAAEDPKPGEPDVDEIRGYLGYAPGFLQRIPEEWRKEQGIKRTHGLVVTQVIAGSPADRAGLKVGDVLDKINGQALPDSSSVGEKDDEAADKYVKEHFTPITHKVRPGDTVEILVDRKGTPVTLKAVAVDRATSEAIREAAIEEENSVQVPPPKDRGAATAATYDFEGLPSDQNRPADLLNVTGLFEVGRGPDGKGNVLRQQNDLGDAFAVVLAAADGRVYGDAKQSVRFVLIAGERYVSAGLVLRAQDRKNWYAARADGVSKTLRILKVENGKPTTLASVDIASPKLGTWHTIEVTAKGDTITATLDGTTKVEAKDATWTSGWSGLLTQGDAETSFDDWVLTPAGT
jgi:hypothetical protein